MKTLRQDLMTKRKNSLYLLFTLLLLLLSFSLPAWATPASQKKKEPPSPSPSQKSHSHSKKNPKPQTSRAKRLWNKFLGKVSHLVPKPIKRGWEKTKKKWAQTVAVYQAMRLLMKGSLEEQKKEEMESKRRQQYHRWLQEDQEIEKKVREEMRLSFWQKACLAGSAHSCLRWAKEEPLKFAPWRTLRDIWLRRQKWNELLPICRRLSELPQHTISDQLCYARSLAALGNIEKAEKIYQIILKEHPRHGLAWLEAGLFQLTKGQRTQGEKLCRRALQLMPKLPKAWECLGEALKKKNPQKALQAYYQACRLESAPACQMVLKLRPKGLKGLVWWSSAITRMSSQTLSWGTLAQSCRFGIHTACRRLAHYYRKKAQQSLKYKQFDKARWLFQKATQLAPEDHENWRALGLYLFHQQAWKQAIAPLRRSLKLNEKQPLVWFALGRCYQRLVNKKKGEADKAFRRACALGENAACRYVKFSR